MQQLLDPGWPSCWQAILLHVLTRRKAAQGQRATR